MANSQLKAKLKEGAAIWNAWRNTNPREAYMGNEYVNLSGTNLSSMNLNDTDLSDANLSDANLSDAQLHGANLGYAQLNGADLTNADLTNAQLHGAKLTDSRLSGARLNGAALGDADLSRADLERADFSGAELSNVNLVDAKLNGANLSRAILNDTNLVDAKLVDAKLISADLYGAKLNRAELDRADLREADLRHTDLRGANLRGAVLVGANLVGANLVGANLVEAIFNGTRFSSRTTLSVLASQLSESEIEGCLFEDDIIEAESEQRDSLLERQVTIQRVIVRATDVQNDLSKVVTPLKLSIKSALIQIENYREEVRQNNQLRYEHLEFHEQLLQMLDQIRDDLIGIYEAIPENVEFVSVEEAENVASYFERFKNETAVQMEKYLSPEALSRAAFPTTIVLTCSAVGSFFGPVGFAAGGHFGNMLANNLKPDTVANKLGDKLNSDSSDTPD